MSFKLHSPFEPTGDQPAAIRELTAGFLEKNYQLQTLLGVTGSGKTFTASHVIKNLGLPTLVIAPNKTLAAQLYGEFKSFFPENAVEYFVSYFDYYQPEAYLPQRDLYIAKESSINEEIEKMRASTLKSLAERDDVIVVASVSCIYNSGKPKSYRDASIVLRVGEDTSREELLERLVALQYSRNDFEPKAKSFRVRGSRIDIFPPYSETGIRIEFFDTEIERIVLFDPITGKPLHTSPIIRVFPATQYIAEGHILENALHEIEKEMIEQCKKFEQEGKQIEAARLRERTLYDLTLLRETGMCPGIENYTRFFDGRSPGDPPYTLLDHFPEDYFLIIDESHVTVPQIRGMYGGDYSRKVNIVAHGFRLPSAFDNRPLKWEEFEERMGRTLFMSATPGPYELRVSQQVVEQVIRPTGLVDPKIIVRPTANQIDDLIARLRTSIEKGHRAIVATLTKKMAEQLAEYLQEIGLKVEYLHSEIDTIDRVILLHNLREGVFDVIVGINLLREGIDLPEVALVAILDADKEGFLRSTRSLIQIMGRAARNSEGTVVLYADEMTEAMRQAIKENNRRRRKQLDYNRRHGITPKSISKEIIQVLEPLRDQSSGRQKNRAKRDLAKISRTEFEQLIEELTMEMLQAARKMEFERAAELRDEIKELQEIVGN